MKLPLNLFFLLLSTLSLLFLSVAASPASVITRRGSDDPGIGVELEWRGGVLLNPDQRANDAKKNNDVLAKVKGSKLIVKGKKTFTDQWKLTAEHSPTIDNDGLKNILYEWIILGEVVKLNKDKNQLPSIAEDIQQSLLDWNPKAGDKVSIDGFEEDKWGAWAVDQPKTFTADAVTFGVQVTAPLPLSAVYDLFKAIDGNDRSNPFLPGGRKYVWIVDKNDIKKLDVMDDTDIDDNVLGFFTLVMSYVKAAKMKGASMKDNGPKQLINIMPRTDFGTMFKLYIKDKLDGGRKCRQKKKEDVNLFTIARDLAKKGNFISEKEMNDLQFMWCPQIAEATAATTTSSPSANLSWF
ncbi:hypothetical protein GQ43DRAFT_301467 [Delitschia confertaspora ATCC 74209]|uniref:Uncharacterized protein n=1 Tax=Delitschia confertaspora ATCC 74209 TaxID=1513339 RepID=A0A9P4JPA7_9PLEO|nr:hypothetical protein GQ43DRAFT_301467 [Delitschia confertaspora ATCC 74209]